MKGGGSEGGIHSATQGRKEASKLSFLSRRKLKFDALSFCSLIVGQEVTCMSGINIRGLSDIEIARDSPSFISDLGRLKS